MRQLQCLVKLRGDDYFGAFFADENLNFHCVGSFILAITMQIYMLLFLKAIF